MYTTSIAGSYYLLPHWIGLVVSLLAVGLSLWILLAPILSGDSSRPDQEQIQDASAAAGRSSVFGIVFFVLAWILGANSGHYDQVSNTMQGFGIAWAAVFVLSVLSAFLLPGRNRALRVSSRKEIRKRSLFLSLVLIILGFLTHS